MAKKKIVSHDDVIFAQADAEVLLETHLRDHGWKHVCQDTPQCMWLWEKEYKGRTLWCTAAVALNVELNIKYEKEFSDNG